MTRSDYLKKYLESDETHERDKELARMILAEASEEETMPLVVQNAEELETTIATKIQEIKRALELYPVTAMMHNFAVVAIFRDSGEEQVRFACGQPVELDQILLSLSKSLKTEDKNANN